MDSILDTFHVSRPKGLRKEDKAELITNKVPYDEILRILENPAQVTSSAPPSRVSGASSEASKAKRQKTLEEVSQASLPKPAGIDSHENGNCGMPTQSGRPCKLTRPCPHHDQQRKAQEEARQLQRLRVEKSICGAVKADGGLCDNIRGQCGFHATDNRCESMLDASPQNRCKVRQKPGLKYCVYHQDFPNLGVHAKAYAEEQRRSNKPCVEADFLKTYYPHRRYTRPPIDFNALLQIVSPESTQQ